MTKSEKILSDIRHEAQFGPQAGTRLAFLAQQIASEYEIAIAQNLHMEATIHELTKSRQGDLGM